MSNTLRVMMAGAVVCSCAMAQAGELASSIVATLNAPSALVQPGEPIWVDFSVTNITDRPVELIVPEVEALPATGVMGLPLSHVFGGSTSSALSLQSSRRQTWESPLSYEAPTAAETLVLAPHASVGVRVELAQHYRILRSAGEFRLQWAPYGGEVVSNRLTIRIDTRKQAIIQTDHGTLTVQFDYDEAPNHVRNFLELVREKFYDNLTFHHFVPGVYLQGGCPNGDGAGIRADGLKLKAELSDQPMDRGSFCMARLENDLDSASCQFFISNTRVPQWDGRYTIFGELVGQESFETLDKLMAVPLSPEGRPKQPVYIRAVRLVEETAMERPTPMASP